MKLFSALLFVVVLLGPQPAFAQWGTPVTRTACATGCAVTDDFADGAVTVTGISVAVGDFIAVTAGHQRVPARTITSIVCGSNTLAVAHRTEVSSGAIDIYFVRATSACTSAVVTLSGASGAGGDAVVTFVVSGTVDPAAETGISTGAGTSAVMTHEAATVTPAVLNVLFIGALNGGNGTYTIDADFTSALNHGFGVVGYRVQTTSTAQAFTNTSVDNESANVALAAFEGTSGGGPSPRRVFID